MAIRPGAPVIVISSHVAWGGVGNRAAVFALERLGFPVIAIPTVILPYHAGHGGGTRVVPPPGDLAALLGEAAAHAPAAAAVLSGYLADAQQAGAVADLVAAVRSRNPGALYLLDPVLGDDGALYMPEAVLAAIRDRLLPLADIVTPNRHELAFLTGWKPVDNDGLIAAASQLGVDEVVVTSAFAGDGEAANLLVAGDAADLVKHRAFPGAPHGVGDLLAALYLAHRLGGTSPLDCLRAATAATTAMVEQAVADGAAELPLAAAQDVLTAPAILPKAGAQ
jgi:pyridoxine kinase